MSGLWNVERTGNWVQDGKRLRAFGRNSLEPDSKLDFQQQFWFHARLLLGTDSAGQQPEVLYRHHFKGLGERGAGNKAVVLGKSHLMHQMQCSLTTGIPADSE